MDEVICRQEMGGGIFLHMIYKPVQELVRCKDCEFRRNMLIPLKSGETIECGGRYHKPDWFCADGKRMEQTE